MFTVKRLMATEVTAAALVALGLAGWIRLHVTGPLAAVLGLALTAAVIVVAAGLRRRWFSPIERQLAVVAGHRKVRDYMSRRVRFERRLTLALEDGSRRELIGEAAIMEGPAEGELGVVFLRHRRLLGFRRLDG